MATSDRPVRLYALALTSSAKEPSYREIVTHGQLMNERGINTHYADFSDLKADVTYIVYITGREEAGTIVGTPIGACSVVIAQTTNAPLTCPMGYGIQEDGKIGLVPCSGRGNCISGVCYCNVDYSGTNCSHVQEMVIDRPNDQYTLIHTTLLLKGKLSESAENIQAALRVLLSTKLSVPPNQVQIRKWDVIHTEISSLARTSAHIQRHAKTTASPQIQAILTLVVKHDEKEEKYAQLSTLLASSTLLDTNDILISSVDVDMR